MSSHWEWVERVTAEHDAQKPFAPENGQPLQFRPGDPVIFTNDEGIEFPQRVTGFFARPEKPCGLYANGARYMLDWACHWFPAKEASLRLDPSREYVPPVTETGAGA